jgi:two-component system, OmpR family, phosphate regulon response regulator PhoB
LIVDDDDAIRLATEGLMIKRGYDVVSVGSGAEALAFLARTVPDLILLDLQMDDMNGWEVLGAIRGNPTFAHCKVVVVTGSGQAVAPGIPILRKPFKLAALLEVLEEPAQVAS